KNLLVGHDNSQLVHVFDLEKMQQMDSIQLPFGHYARSIAESNVALMAVVRKGSAPSATGGASAWLGGDSGGAVVDRVDLRARTAATLPSLGIWANSLTSQSALTSSPNGAYILLAETDGNIKLYSAAADTF